MTYPFLETGSSRGPEAVQCSTGEIRSLGHCPCDATDGKAGDGCWIFGRRQDFRSRAGAEVEESDREAVSVEGVQTWRVSVEN